MSTRYAIIIPGDDGSEVVSTVGQFEGGAPQVSFGTVEKVADGVLIGMVRGGTVNAVDGFGFPDGTNGTGGRAASIAKAETAVVRKAKAAKKAKSDEPVQDAAADVGKGDDAKTEA